MAQSKLFPLRKEVTKLSKDNYLLRMDSIHSKDQNLAKTLADQEELKSLQNRLAGLQDVCRVKDDMIRQLESKVLSLQQARLHILRVYIC